ncbi:MAG: hypothetical protein QS721_11145 [Candidatus Endonucleobacter sp. (ex Gigantidas childressi)]|nr:hypothetical protein [Candidatus Endonucleobacter sp. (ex Gigantidas childressi)]
MGKSFGGVGDSKPLPQTGMHNYEQQGAAAPETNQFPVRNIQPEIKIPSVLNTYQLQRPLLDYTAQPVSLFWQMKPLPGVGGCWQKMAQYSSDYMFVHGLQNNSAGGGYQLVYLPVSQSPQGFSNALWQKQYSQMLSSREEILYGLLAGIEQQKQALIGILQQAYPQPTPAIMQQIMPPTFWPQVCSINSLMNMATPLPPSYQGGMNQFPVPPSWAQPKEAGVCGLGINQNMGMSNVGFYAMPEPPQSNMCVPNPLYGTFLTQMDGGAFQHGEFSNKDLSYQQAQQSSIGAPSVAAHDVSKPPLLLPESENVKAHLEMDSQEFIVLKARSKSIHVQALDMQNNLSVLKDCINMVEAREFSGAEEQYGERLYNQLEDMINSINKVTSLSLENQAKIKQYYGRCVSGCEKSKSLDIKLEPQILEAMSRDSVESEISSEQSQNLKLAHELHLEASQLRGRVHALRGGVSNKINNLGVTETKYPKEHEFLELELQADESYSNDINQTNNADPAIDQVVYKTKEQHEKTINIQEQINIDKGKPGKDLIKDNNSAVANNNIEAPTPHNSSYASEDINDVDISNNKARHDQLILSVNKEIECFKRQTKDWRENTQHRHDSIEDMVTELEKMRVTIKELDSHAEYFLSEDKKTTRVTDQIRDDYGAFSNQISSYKNEADTVESDIRSMELNIEEYNKAYFEGAEAYSLDDLNKLSKDLLSLLKDINDADTSLKTTKFFNHIDMFSQDIEDSVNHRILLPKEKSVVEDHPGKTNALDEPLNKVPQKPKIDRKKRFNNISGSFVDISKTKVSEPQIENSTTNTSLLAGITVKVLEEIGSAGLGGAYSELYYDENDNGQPIVTSNAGNDTLTVGGGGSNGAFHHVLGKDLAEDCGTVHEKLASKMKTLQSDVLCMKSPCDSIVASTIIRGDLGNDGLQKSNSKECKTGTVIIDIFKDSNRPNNNTNNTGMVYIVPPNGREIKNDSLFNQVKGTAKNYIRAVKEHNKYHDEKIKVLRVCPYSAGIYLNESTNRDTILSYIIEGMEEQLQEYQKEGMDIGIESIELFVTFTKVWTDRSLIKDKKPIVQYESQPSHGNLAPLDEVEKKSSNDKALIEGDEPPSEDTNINAELHTNSSGEYKGMGVHNNTDKYVAAAMEEIKKLNEIEKEKTNKKKDGEKEKCDKDGEDDSLGAEDHLPSEALAITIFDNSVEKFLSKYEIQNTLARLVENIKPEDSNYFVRRYNNLGSIITKSSHQEHEEEIKKLKSDILSALSTHAGSKLENDNPDIADLSDSLRIGKLGDKHTSIYDNEWTDFLEALEDHNVEEINGIQKMHSYVEECYNYLYDVRSKIVDSSEFADMKVYSSDSKKLISNITIKDKLRSIFLETRNGSYAVKDIFYNKELELRLGDKDSADDRSAKKFSYKVFELITFMMMHNPPCELLFSKHGDEYDKDVHRHFTKSGTNIIDYPVWPALIICKGGACINKGVIQPKTKSQP